MAAIEVPMRITKGYKLPSDREFVWKQLADSTYAVKVSYTDSAGNQLYAVFDSRHVATGEHLTLDQVLERSPN